MPIKEVRGFRPVRNWDSFPWDYQLWLFWTRFLPSWVWTHCSSLLAEGDWLTVSPPSSRPSVMSTLLWVKISPSVMQCIVTPPHSLIISGRLAFGCKNVRTADCRVLPHARRRSQGFPRYGVARPPQTTERSLQSSVATAISVSTSIITLPEGHASV